MSVYFYTATAVATLWCWPASRFAAV